jgi:hypothetical protein
MPQVFSPSVPPFAFWRALSQQGHVDDHGEPSESMQPVMKLFDDAKTSQNYQHTIHTYIMTNCTFCACCFWLDEFVPKTEGITYFLLGASLCT